MTSPIKFNLFYLSALILAILAAIPYFPKPPQSLPAPKQTLGAISSPPASASGYLVTSIVDGDTIKVMMGDQLETVRLLAINTPETHKPGTPVECYGPEASAHLQELIGTSRVILTSDTIQGDRDRYGRLLRYVYLPDGTLVNAKMVADGYALAYTALKSDQLDKILSLELLARSQNLGLWAECNYAN